MNKLSLINKLSIVIVIIVGIIAFSFAILKAYFVPFTYDEAYTFIHFLPQDFMNIISLAKPFSANNHILSTLFVKLSQNIFGSSEIALRIPSLISFSIYIVFSILIIRKINIDFILPGFVLLISNPYLLDFFALARGYSLAISLMMVSIFLWINYRETEEKKWYIQSLILAGFSALSNFSLLLFVASLLLLNNYYGFLRERAGINNFKQFLSRFLKWNKINFIFLSILFIVFYEPIRRCIKYKLLYHGGHIGFWSDSIMSLLKYSLYNANYTKLLLLPLSWLLIVVLLTSLIFLFQHVKKSILRIGDITNWNYDFILLFLLIISISISMHFLGGNRYPIDRGSLFLYPIIILIIMVTVNKLFFQFNFKKITLILTIFASTCFVLHTIKTQNLIDFIQWKHDSQTKIMLEDLEAYRNQEFCDSNKMYFGTSWIFYPVVNYYIISKGLNWLELVSDKGIVGKEDYIYLKQMDVVDYQKSGYVIIKNYPITNSTLLKYNENI